MCYRVLLMSAPRRFAALAIGELLAGHSWNGTVLSIHKSALYILRGDDLVVSLVADEGSMTAMSVLVPMLFDTPLDDSLIGRASSRAKSRLLIADFAAIDLAACPVWSGRVAGFKPDSGTPDMLRRVKKALVKFGKFGGLLGVLAPALSAESQSLWVAAARKALEAGSFGKLVGLGPGLTPAGDDFLAGAQLAATIFGTEWPGSLTLDPGQIRAALAGTTPAGRTLLWMVLQGQFPALFVNFARAFSHASGLGLEAAVRDACSYGDSSGTDALTGFCWMASRFTHLA